MTQAVAQRPSIYVLAGTNGAGKSSVAGATFRALGANYFNPDEAARQIVAVNPGVSLQAANAAAWTQGKQGLEDAIARKLTFAFETTLGGKTITDLLVLATQSGIAVRIWYVGLSSPELHIARVRARVAAGGHDIPEGKIRERYDQSRINLIRLVPGLTQLRMFDNSVEGHTRTGFRPKPKLVLAMRDGARESCMPLTRVPEWAKPIVLAALHRPGH